jgi:hypothetical protein
MSARSYTPKSVLLTGAAGFIASNTCIRLVKNHHDVKFVVLDKLDYCANLKNLDPVKNDKNFFFVKVRLLTLIIIDTLPCCSRLIPSGRKTDSISCVLVRVTFCRPIW